MKKPYKFDFQKLGIIYSKYNTIQAALESKEKGAARFDRWISQHEIRLKELKREYNNLQAKGGRLARRVEELEGQEKEETQLLDDLHSRLEKTRKERNRLGKENEQLKTTLASNEERRTDQEVAIGRGKESIRQLSQRTKESNGILGEAESHLRKLRDDTAEMEDKRNSLAQEVAELKSALENKDELERTLLTINEKVKDSQVLSILASLIEKPQTLTYDKELLLVPLSHVIRGVTIYVNNNNNRKKFNAPRGITTTLDSLHELILAEVL